MPLNLESICRIFSDIGGGNILAPLGHALTHAIQRAHFAMSVAILFSKMEIAPVGHAAMHFLQSVHESVDIGVAGTVKSALYG